MSRVVALVVVFFCAWIALAHSQEPPPAQPLPEQPSVNRPAPVTSIVPPAPPPAAVESVTEWWQSSGWWIVAAIALVALVGAVLAMYAARLWKSSAALLQETKDSTRKELRAYVALDEIFFTEAGDAAAGLHKLRIRNYGQTPASRMSIWCERASHLPQDGVNPYYDAPVVDGQLLHPVQAYTVALAAAPLYRIGKPGFFTYGRIIYHDIYEQWWVTRFCFRYEGDGSFVPNGDYNAEEGPFDKKPV
jgi:hypothetical protein